MSGNCHAPTGNLFAPRRFGQACFARDATRLALAITGGSSMWKAHRAMESITMDREVPSLKDDLMPRYARLIHNSYWFSPDRKLLQGLIDASQKPVNGRVDDGGAYNQADAGGFIKLNALRMRIAGNLAKGRRK